MGPDTSVVFMVTCHNIRIIPLAHIINNSLASSNVPEQWKFAVITPVPKINNPTSPADYRPISILPILSRIMERIVVRTYLYPEFCKPPLAAELHDQFAFRPTGSTTAAVTAFLHHTHNRTTQEQRLRCDHLHRLLQSIRHPQA